MIDGDWIAHELEEPHMLVKRKQEGQRDRTDPASIGRPVTLGALRNDSYPDLYVRASFFCYLRFAVLLSLVPLRPLLVASLGAFVTRRSP